MTVLVICIALLAVQQIWRWCRLRSVERDVNEQRACVAAIREAGVDVRRVRIVAPWLWPFTGPIHVRYYFKTPEDA